jgi:hypothetical protein
MSLRRPQVLTALCSNSNVIDSDNHQAVGQVATETVSARPVTDLQNRDRSFSSQILLSSPLKQTSSALKFLLPIL